MRWALHLGLGVGPLLAGLDKSFNILVDWQMYLSPLAERLLPVSGAAFMRTVGVVEMAVGVIFSPGGRASAPIVPARGFWPSRSIC